MKEKAFQFSTELTMNATSAEKHFYKILESLGIKFWFQYPIFNKDRSGNIKKFYIADFYLPDSNTIVEIDGGYHNSREQKLWDTIRSWKIKENHKNVSIVRITNGTVFNGIKLMKVLNEIQERER